MSNLIKLAEQWHHQIPKHSGVLDLLRNRGVTAHEVRRWRIGFCDNAKSAMYSRITIPVFSLCGNVISISGRTISNQEPKYWHYPYQKSRILYGQHLARKCPYLVLVEGQIDTIIVDSLGEVALGVMGSSLSIIQATLIKIWTDTVVVYPDGNGLSSAAKWLPTLKQVGLRTAMPPVPFPVSAGARSATMDPADLGVYDRQYMRNQIAHALERMHERDILERLAQC